MVIGIILASGFSNRMGQDKLLLEVEGKRILEKVILAAKNSKLDDVVLPITINSSCALTFIAWGRSTPEPP